MLLVPAVGCLTIGAGGERPSVVRERVIAAGNGDVHHRVEAAMKSRDVLGGILVLTLLLPLLASAQDSLVVYSSVDEENAKKLLDSFTKATGVKVRFTFLSSGPAVARIEAEKNNPLARSEEHTSELQSPTNLVC